MHERDDDEVERPEVLRRDALVDRELGQRRRRERGRGGEEQREEGQDHAAAVGPQQLDQAAQLAPAPAGRAPAAAEVGEPLLRLGVRAAHRPATFSIGSRLRKTWSGSPLAAISAYSSLSLQQLVVRAAGGDLAVLEHDDVVGQRDRGEPVGDHERGAAAHRLAQRLLDRLLGRGVDRGGGVVEHEDARVDHQRPRDRDPLALAAGERQPALADHGVVAVGQLGDEARRLRALGGPLDLLAGGVRPPVGDVVVDGGAEQERVVGDDADLRAQRVELDVADVGAVDQHRAAGDVVVAAEQRDERRLARAGGADQRDRGAALDGHVDAAQHRRAVLIVERDVAQLHAPVALGQRPRVLRRGDPGLDVEDLEQPHARRGRALAEAERDAERAHRRDQHQQVRVEGREARPASACRRSRGGRRRSGSPPGRAAAGSR